MQAAKPSPVSCFYQKRARVCSLPFTITLVSAFAYNVLLLSKHDPRQFWCRARKGPAICSAKISNPARGCRLDHIRFRGSNYLLA